MKKASRPATWDDARKLAAARLRKERPASRSMEYLTTFGHYTVEDRFQSDSADDPVRPAGEGWQLVGFAAASGLLFWAWARQREETT